METRSGVVVFGLPRVRGVRFKLLNSPCISVRSQPHSACWSQTKPTVTGLPAPSPGEKPDKEHTACLLGISSTLPCWQGRYRFFAGVQHAPWTPTTTL